MELTTTIGHSTLAFPEGTDHGRWLMQNCVIAIDIAIQDSTSPVGVQRWVAANGFPPPPTSARHTPNCQNPATSSCSNLAMKGNDLKCESK
jgi:hypothetical protein